LDGDNTSFNYSFVSFFIIPNNIGENIPQGLFAIPWGTLPKASEKKKREKLSDNNEKKRKKERYTTHPPFPYIFSNKPYVIEADKNKSSSIAKQKKLWGD
jgi:hypothetical protein